MNPHRQIILLSGGSKGLGATLASGLLAQGHVVVTFSRTETGFVRETRARHPESEFVWEAVDALDEKSLGRLVGNALERFGRVDALINNAAVALDGVLALTRGEDARRVIETNLYSPIRLSSLVSRAMLRQGHGKIVNISSIVGVRGYSGLSVYSATKAALDGFTRSLARELGPCGVRVNSIAPGYLETQMSEGLSPEQRSQIVRRTPLGRLGPADDVLGTLLFLLSPGASFVTGQTLAIDGGITC